MVLCIKYSYLGSAGSAPPWERGRPLVTVIIKVDCCRKAAKIFLLKLSVDTHYGSVMDYFEIFLQRMILCRKAAEKLGLQFKLMINEQQLI